MNQPTQTQECKRLSLRCVPIHVFIETVIDAVHDEQKLNSFTNVADYIGYLAYISAHMPEQPERIRTITTYLLKNNSRAVRISTSPEAVEFVKQSILRAFTDPSAQVRVAASQAIVAYLAVFEPRNWPECLSLLVTSLDSPDGNVQEVCLFDSPNHHPLIQPTLSPFPDRFQRD